MTESKEGKKKKDERTKPPTGERHLPGGVLWVLSHVVWNWHFSNQSADWMWSVDYSCDENQRG